MKRFLPSYLLSLLLTGLFALMSVQSYASHVIGAELRYRHIPGTCDDYEITVYLYGDCNAPSLSSFRGLPISTPHVCIYDGTTPVATLQMNLPVPQCGEEVTPVCPDSLAWTTCNNTSFPISGIKKFTYKLNYTFPYRSANWKLVYNADNGSGLNSYVCTGSLGTNTTTPPQSGRTGSISNITTGTYMQVVSSLNNSFTNPRGFNSSPVLTVEPTPFYCNGFANCYNPGAIDLNDVVPVSTPSGDSLNFTLVPATNGTLNCGTIGGPVTYVGPGISGSNPLTVSGPITFDPLTGQLCFTPSALQRSVVVYNIEEYINDTLGVMSTIAGLGIPGYGGDGSPAVSALINKPTGLVRNSIGEVFIADCMNNRIRKIDLAGNMSTFAGTGTAGYTGDGGSAITATLRHPMGLALDAGGNLYIADSGNHVVRKINPAGVITTIAGNGIAGFAGDGGLASSPICQLNSPVAVCVATTGNVYISDNGNNRVRRITAAGIISTIAGTGGAGATGDSGPAVAAALNGPFGLAVDATGNVFVADSRNNKIRQIGVGGVITTVVGDATIFPFSSPGIAGFGGDGGKAAVAACRLNHPTGVIVDNNGNLLVADQYNNRIRFVDNCGYINTIDGNGTPGFLGDGAPPALAALDSMMFVAKDNKGNIYISDYSNNRIRKVIRNANINKVVVGTMQREMNFLVTTCSYTAPTGKIDTGYGGGIGKIDSTHYYGCANSGTFVLRTNPRESDTSLHITVTCTGLGSGFTFGVDSNNTNHPHDSITGNTSVILPGTYTFFLTYTDNHCPLTGTQTIAFTVTILPVPTVRDSLVSAAICTAPAKFYIIPGGTGKPWTIKVSHAPPSFFTTDTFQIFTADTTLFRDSLVPGNYNITIFTSVSTDCAQTIPLFIATPTFNITGNGYNPTYCGANDGYIVLHGLTPGNIDSVIFKFQGAWQPKRGFVVTTTGVDTIFNLLAGVYDSIQVSENLCKTNFVGPITLTNPPFTFREVTTKNPTKCGFCDGVDTLFGLHPGQLDTIKYDYTSPAGVVTTFSLPHFIGLDSTVVISGLCAGTYTNYIVNTAGVCNASLAGPRNLVAPRIFANFDTVVHYGCQGDTIFFNNLSAPAPDLTYQWFFGDGATSVATNPIHNYINTIANTVAIKLYVTNTKCVDSFIRVKTFDNYIKSGFTMVPTKFICQDSVITFTNTSVGTNPTYTWIFGDGTMSTATNPTHTYSKTGNYTIKLVANENMLPVPAHYTACFDTSYATIAIDSNSSVSIAATDTTLCQGQGITFKGIFSTIGDTLVTWSFGDGSTIYNQNPIAHSFDSAATFVIDLSVKYRSCPSSTVSRSVNVFGYPNMYLGPDLFMCPGGEPVRLLDDRNSTNPNAHWKWNTGATTSGITVSKPGTYIGTVYVNGCYTTDTVLVQKDCYMDMPNIFTPNGDGTNDFFYPRQMLTKGLTSFKMDIYNRWGQMVYQTTLVDGKGWDGNFNDKPQPEGVYVYVIDAVFKDGQVEHHQGNITLLR